MDSPQKNNRKWYIGGGFFIILACASLAVGVVRGTLLHSLVIAVTTLSLGQALISVGKSKDKSQQLRGASSPTLAQLPPSVSVEAIFYKGVFETKRGVITATPLGLSFTTHAGETLFSEPLAIVQYKNRYFPASFLVEIASQKYKFIFPAKSNYMGKGSFMIGQQLSDALDGYEAALKR